MSHDWIDGLFTKSLLSEIRGIPSENIYRTCESCGYIEIKIKLSWRESIYSANSFGTYLPYNSCKKRIEMIELAKMDLALE